MPWALLLEGTAPKAPIVSESPVRGRVFEGLPTNGSSECPAELLFVPAVGEPLAYRPFSLPLVDLAIPIGPLPLDRVVEGFLAVDVVPQPL